MKKPKVENKAVKRKFMDVVKEFDWKKIGKVAFVIVFGASFAYNVVTFTGKPKEVEVEVPVDKEVIKYVEKEGGTPTNEIVMHLNSRIDPSTAKLIGKAVDESSKKYSLSRKLVLSIMRHESFFNPLSKSFKDCIGLMQINPKAHPEKVKDIPKTHLYHIDINLDIGCRIFREYLDKNKGDLHKTFHAYLGKKAKKQQIEKYKNDILYTFAMLEMYEYMGKNSKIKEGKEIELNGKNDKDNVHNTPVKPNDGVPQTSD